MTLRFAYPDTCLLVPLFIEEQGTKIAERMIVEFTKGGEVPLIVSELTRLEFASVVTKSARMGAITVDQAQHVLTCFTRHCESHCIVLPVQPINFQTAQRWIELQKTSLRTFDALHLAIASDNHCILLTADKQLAAAAVAFDIEHYFVPQTIEPR
ncbi:MAG: type II toxin-antitoxin system VapC family toxin [Planctomycetaceae bacterium]|nr:type II toxin-antitoxin system VapC family toxin [Planctomycetaceae bacterium]